MARDLIDKEALLARLPELVSTCSSTSHIAREMGVSLDTLRRTLKAEGIPTIYADLAKHFFGPGNPDGGIEEARQLAELVERLPRIPAMSWKKSKGKRQKTALLLVSDIQMGQKVEPAAIFPGATQKLDFLAYSAEVAHRRVKRLFSRLLDLTEQQRAGCDVPELVIFLLGDLVDHSCLRETQTRFVEINAMRQAIEVFHALASGLRAIAPFFPKIRIVSVSGNHGRLDRKMSWFSPTENFDWLVAKMLEEAFADSKHISFDIPETWWAQAEVAGWQFLAFHGEDVRRWQSFPFVGMTKAAQGYQNVIRTVNREGGDLAHFDYVLAGHHHNLATWESCAGSCEVIMNGTFVPVSEFSLKALREMNRVSQLVGFVSHEEGLEERIPVRLMHA